MVYEKNAGTNHSVDRIWAYARNCSFKRNLFKRMLVTQLPYISNAMNKRFRNDYHYLIANLHKTDGYIVNHFSQKLAPFDLSVQQYLVLRRLSEVYPNSLTAGELKEKMDDLNPDMTRLTDRLMAKNLIVREVDSQNRRRVNLRLTEATNQFVETVAIEFNDFESIVSHLTHEEVKTLNALLDKIQKK